MSLYQNRLRRAEKIEYKKFENKKKIIKKNM